MLECYTETLGITLGQLGIDTDDFGLRFQQVVEDFQQHLLYGFIVGVLMAMASTDPSELVDLGTKIREGDASVQPLDLNSKYLPLTVERREYLLDLVRDIGAYVESKDFELGLPLTNFKRYQELWSMEDKEGDDEDDDEEEEEEGEEEEEEEEYESAEEE